jgi:hypothetical protein
LLQNITPVSYERIHAPGVGDAPVIGSFEIASAARIQIALVTFGSALMALAITRESLWIDEAWTAWFASHGNARSLLHAVAWTNGSEAQMPGYLLYVFAWVKLFGRGEIALRFANLPFAVLLLTSMSWLSSVLLKRPYAWLIFSLTPFLWFYMNEARPYLALMASSSVIAAAVLAYCMEAQRYDHVAPWLAMSSFTAGLALHMLAAFLAPTVLLFLVMSTKGNWRRLVSDWYRAVLVFLPWIAGIIAYYAWTISRGAGGVRSEAGFGNLAFVFYEFCGFGGLGPPRNDLRATGGAGLLAYWPLLTVGCVALISVLTTIAIASHRQIDRDFALSVAVGFVIAVLACKLAHFRFLGRHLAAFCPFGFIALLMNTRVQGKRGHRWIAAGALTLLAGAWAISDARQLRPSYSKEDYRSATAYALQAARPNEKSILWAADGVAAHYYGLKTEENLNNSAGPKHSTSEPLDWPVLANGLLASNWTSAEVDNYTREIKVPTILVLAAKPDLFDQNGGWAWLLRQPERHTTRIATFNGFDIYELSPGL